MKRKIITINEEKCTGCGQCIPDCPEGALQLIDGKARLVSDLFCDGLGACVKACPVDAMSVEEREAEPYDEKKVMGNIVKGGKNVIIAHLKHLKEHNERELLGQALDYLKEHNIDIPDYESKQHGTHPEGGCPGSRSMRMAKEIADATSHSTSSVQSTLTNWPIQLRLLNPNAQYLDNADLLIAADCTAFSYGDFHRKFIKDKILIMFCPKLDQNLEQYVEKLAAIFSAHTINSITLVKMEVPCCGGVEHVVRKALELSGKSIFVKDYTVSLRGELI
ncbi:MAG: 4Fe-4S dicluster domain-containing protein [Candidatus Auribacterota bacterium]|jgi:NAD-dependent dihydropyrimidine dehydrogenase PreA subunit|uniref:4Fe-4S dicluster domain-containing protein n=1 Tax=Candidatus Auribacter fodinae TaxID=2093366 RepID=A0A3A4R5V2_9BACT|nr:MAG: 4Fe-4S dicluster domain-containing protein [Candidatus Auribacter fodinae]